MSAARHFPLLTLLLLVGGCTMLQQARSPELDAERRLQLGLASLDAGMYAEAFDELSWVYSRCAGYAASHQALAGLAAIELDPRNPAGREAVGAELLGRLIQHSGPPAWTRPLAESAYLMALALGAAPAPTTRAGAALDTTSDDPSSRARADREQEAATDSAMVTDTTAARAAAPAGVEADTSDAAAVESPNASEARPAGPLAVPEVSGQEEPAYGCGPRVEDGEWVAPQLPVLPGPSVMAILARSEEERATLASRTDSLSQALATTRRQLDETQAELERIRKTLTP